MSVDSVYGPGGAASTCHRGRLRQIWPASPDAPRMHTTARKGAFWCWRAGLATAAREEAALEAECHYRILGVPVGTDCAAKLREAYVTRAKELHPDSSHSSGAPQSRAAFQQLAASYSVLRSPERRRLYDLQLAAMHANRRRQGMGSRLRAAAAAAAAAGESADGRTVTPWASRTEGLHALAHRAGLDKELQNALSSAYYGPPISLDDADDGLLPGAFECDIRTQSGDTEEVDVLHVVSGRTLLGVVRHARTATLGAPAPHQLRRPDVPRSAAQMALPDVADEGGEDADDEDELHLLCGRSAELAARAIRRRGEGISDAGGAPDIGGGHILVFLRGDRACRVLDPGGRFGMGRVVDAVTGADTHTLVRNATPGVSHLHVFQAEAPADNASATSSRRQSRCVARATRAVLPPAALWLFPPRVETHAAGGWYIEAPQQEDAASQYDLRLLLPLLLGFDTLDRERQSATVPWSRLQAFIQRGWNRRSGDNTQR